MDGLVEEIRIWEGKSPGEICDELAVVRDGLDECALAGVWEVKAGPQGVPKLERVEAVDGVGLRVQGEVDEGVGRGKGVGRGRE